MTRPDRLLATPPRPAEPVDMRTLFRHIGNGVPAPMATPSWRRAVRRHDGGRTDVHSTGALSTTATVDGVQSGWLIHRIDGRPISLHQIGAAATSGRVEVSSIERMFLAASTLDAAWCRALPGGLPLIEVDGVSPQAVAQATDETVDTLRRRFELEVTNRALETVGGPVLVDGSIRELGTIQSDIVGVVKKSTDTQLLGDEQELELLPVGHRSSPFTWLRDYIHQHEVHCAYVRLHAPGWRDEWTHGLVRIETLDPDLLDSLASRCLQERQDRYSGDPRWPVHLRTVRQTEEILKARLPSLR